MASELPCGFIAQQCLVLASFSFTVLFIAKATPWAASEVMTLSPRDIGTCSMCMIKGDDITLTHDVFVVCASMVLEPHRRGHMAIVTPLDQWAVCHFLGGKRISDHY
jgi:hypothetical protein